MCVYSQNKLDAALKQNLHEQPQPEAAEQDGGGALEEEKWHLAVWPVVWVLALIHVNLGDFNVLEESFPSVCGTHTEKAWPVEAKRLPHTYVTMLSGFRQSLWGRGKNCMDWPCWTNRNINTHNNDRLSFKKEIAAKHWRSSLWLNNLGYDMLYRLEAKYLQKMIWIVLVLLQCCCCEVRAHWYPT